MKKKGFWLVLLTSLSMAGGLISLIVYLTAIIHFESLTWFNFIPGFTSIKSTISDSHFIYPYIKIPLILISIVGAYFMFMRRQKGFYLYSSAQLVMIFLSVILSENKFWVSFIDEYPNIIFTIAFIWSYSFFLKDFKVTDINDAEVKK